MCYEGEKEKLKQQKKKLPCRFVARLGRLAGRAGFRALRPEARFGPGPRPVSGPSPPARSPAKPALRPVEHGHDGVDGARLRRGGAGTRAGEGEGGGVLAR